MPSNKISSAVKNVTEIIESAGLSVAMARPVRVKDGKVMIDFKLTPAQTAENRAKLKAVYEKAKDVVSSVGLSLAFMRPVSVRDGKTNLGGKNAIQSRYEVKPTVEKSSSPRMINARPDPRAIKRY